MSTTNAARTALFRSLHNSTGPLALSNAWDVASALIAEAAGAPAVATTSAGVAWTLGRADGDKLDRASAVAAVARIAAAVSVPVTADIEGGFGATTEEVVQTVLEVINAGAVGINIEDGSLAPEEFAARLSAIRSAVTAAGLDLFVNARTDVFLVGEGSEEEQAVEALRRAHLYVDAGADGIFVPGAASEAAIRALAEGILAPLNIMVWPGMLSVRELGERGVARVSLGSATAQAAYAVAQRAAVELATTGTYDSVRDALDYGSMNALFTSQ